MLHVPEYHMTRLSDMIQNTESAMMGVSTRVVVSLVHAGNPKFRRASAVEMESARNRIGALHLNPT